MFKKKIVLIIGSSSGIGKETALSFSKNNYYVIATTSKKNMVYDINNYLKNNGLGIYLNLNNNKSIKNLFELIKYKYKHINILINNSSILKDKLLINMKEEDILNVLNINLISVFKICKLSAKIMIKKKYGRIINIGSILGLTGNIGQSNYSASKSGLIGLTKSLSKEISKYGITVNIISLGFIYTNMTKNLSLKIKKNFLSKIDMKRFGKIKEVVNVIRFISSKNSSYITGEIINVNGGM